MGLPAAYLKAKLIARLTPAPEQMAAPAGRQAILKWVVLGRHPRAQVKAAIAAGLRPQLLIDPLDVASGTQSAGKYPAVDR